MQSMATSLPAVTADELRKIRDEMDMTQDELAEAIGVHRVTIAKWEAGTRGISEPIARLVEKIRAEHKRRKR